MTDTEHDRLENTPDFNDLLTVSRRGFMARAISAGVLCAAPVPTSPTGSTTGAKLKYNPSVVAPLAPGYTTFTLTGSGPGPGKTHTINLATNQHARIVLPNNKWVGQLNVQGNGVNTIHIIGGWISNPWTSNGGANRGIIIRNVRRSYIEGVRVDKDHFAGTAIVFSSNSGTNLGEAWVQNCLMTGINYMDSGGTERDPYTQHGDFIQLQSQMRGLYIDKTTSYYWNTGLVFNQRFADDYMSGPAVVNGIHISRFNCVLYDSNKNPKRTLISGAGYPSKNHKAFFFSDACSYSTDSRTRTVFRLDQVYAEDLQRTTDPQGGTRRQLGQLCAPWQDAYSSCAGLVTGDQYLGQYSHSLLLATGYVKGGLPTAGDFVNGGTLSDTSRGPVHNNAFTGLGYASPGYL
jgi:hypothetical protein